VLDGYKVNRTWVDFDLSGVYDYMSGDSINDTLNASGHLDTTFTMAITTGTKEYMCFEAAWTAFQYNSNSATFNLQGHFTKMERYNEV
jgi:hypothetical protein